METISHNISCRPIIISWCDIMKFKVEVFEQISLFTNLYIQNSFKNQMIKKNKVRQKQQPFINRKSTNHSCQSQVNLAILLL